MSVYDASGHTLLGSLVGYDALNQIVSFIDPSGLIWSVYQTTSAIPLGGCQIQAYAGTNCTGNPILQTFANSQLPCTASDGSGNLIAYAAASQTATAVPAQSSFSVSSGSCVNQSSSPVGYATVRVDNSTGKYVTPLRIVPAQ